MRRGRSSGWNPCLQWMITRGPTEVALHEFNSNESVSEKDTRNGCRGGCLGRVVSNDLASLSPFPFCSPRHPRSSTKSQCLALQSNLRVRHREETRVVSRLTMENMNLASRCRDVISQVAALKKEILIYQKRQSEWGTLQREVMLL